MLAIYVSIPAGNVEVEMSFSYVRRIHNRLCSNMSMGWFLGDLAVMAMHALTILFSKTKPI